MSEPEWLFAYGTLRKELGNPMHEMLARQSELVGRAVFQGRLFLVGEFPGAVDSSREEEVVHGEVYQLGEGFSFEGLDEYEGCEEDGEGALFRRERRRVRLGSREELWAWIYLYNQPTEALQRIESGDYSRGVKSLANGVGRRAG